MFLKCRIEIELSLFNAFSMKYHSSEESLTGQQKHNALTIPSAGVMCGQDFLYSLIEIRKLGYHLEKITNFKLGNYFSLKSLITIQIFDY